MTRAELLRAVVRQAKVNGFEFRKWYTTRLRLPWIGFEASIEALSKQRRFYALLFSHVFARSFWLPGSNIAFIVPHSSFTRVSKDGATKVVERRGHTRRTAKADAWRYHLKTMAGSEEPLRYIRKFLLIEEDLNGIQPVSDAEEPAPDAAEDVYSEVNGDLGEQGFAARG
jgi:hypothetical protein